MYKQKALAGVWVIMKNYLIIGASSGIGNALAHQLVSEGNQVYGTYFKNESPSPNHNLHFHYFNCNDANVEFSYLPEQINGLAFCPGSIVLKPFNRIKPEEFISDFEFQVVGLIKVIQAVLPHLKRSENASIVLFSSVAAQLGLNFHSLVGATKGAIEGLTRSLAAELAPTIRVNCIAPSLTNTPLAAALINSEEKLAANALRHPLKRIGTVTDIANCANFLLSDKSSWITGQVLHPDGGIGKLKV